MTSGSIPAHIPPGKVRVVHGPTPDALVQSGEHRIGVDTGCGSEGLLSAVASNDDGAVTVTVL